MKLQQNIQRQSREISELWDDWLRNQEHKQMQGMMREEPDH